MSPAALKLMRRSTARRHAIAAAPKPTVPTTKALLGMISENTAVSHATSWANDTTAISRTLDYASFYYHTSTTFPDADMVSCVPAPAYLMATWYGWPDSEVNAGMHDAAISARAAGLLALGVPVFLRWDIEMNIDSYNYETSPGAWNSANGPTFISAWQRVWGLFQAAGATNVAFVWCPNSNGPGDPNGWRPFYPGDAYVDWVGVDAYNFGNSSVPAGSVWQTMYQTAHAFIDDWAAGFGGAMVTQKPLMIGEGASVEGGGSKAWWLTDAAGYLRSRGLKAWTYFNSNQSSSGNNYRFDSSSSAAQAFKEIVQDPYWGGTDTHGSGYAAAVLADSPLAYWKFNELTGTYTDSSSGGSNPATVSGSVSTRGCPALHGGLGASYSAYGSGWLDLGTLGSFGSGIGSGFTMSFLYKHGGGSTIATILGVLNTGTTTALWVTANMDHSGANAGKTNFAVRNQGGVQRYVDINTNIYDGLWHYVQWVCNPGAGADTIWIDGSAVTPTASVTPTAGTFANFGFSLYVGGRNNRGSIDQTAVAFAIDELAIFPTKLTTTRFTAHNTALAA